MAKGASHNRGSSRQDWGTPLELLAAVEHRFGRIVADLACTAENAVHTVAFTDSFSIPWEVLDIPERALAWLNPPYADIRPWAQRARSSGIRIAMLVPASVGANWWRDYVHNVAQVQFLNGRVTFRGAKQPYPKDCAVVLYGFPPGYHVWRWADDAIG